jgi:hypothetical protein
VVFVVDLVLHPKRERKGKGREKTKNFIKEVKAARRAKAAMEQHHGGGQPGVQGLGKAGKLLQPHERAMVESGELRNVTHHGASAIWLEAASKAPGPGRTLVYRPMGDLEALHVVAHNQLPSTQPYQAIIEGEAGRTYAEKYLAGKKWVDTAPTTVMEFDCPAQLIEALFAIQHKPEDGAMSMGLGHKAGGGLPLFNQSLADGYTTWRVVKVKRQHKERGGGGGGGAKDGREESEGVRGRAVRGGRGGRGK